ncbi:hypothetical protein D3C85_1297960 [compost metagenome]
MLLILLSGSKILKIYLPAVNKHPVSKPPEIAARQVGLPLVKNLNSMVNQVVTIITKTNWLITEVRTNPKEGEFVFKYAPIKACTLSASKPIKNNMPASRIMITDMARDLRV